MRFKPNGGLWEGYTEDADRQQAGWFDSRSVTLEPVNGPVQFEDRGANAPVEPTTPKLKIPPANYEVPVTLNPAYQLIDSAGEVDGPGLDDVYNNAQAFVAGALETLAVGSEAAAPASSPKRTAASTITAIAAGVCVETPQADRNSHSPSACIGNDAER